MRKHLIIYLIVILFFCSGCGPMSFTDFELFFTDQRQSSSSPAEFNRDVELVIQSVHTQGYSKDGVDYVSLRELETEVPGFSWKPSFSKTEVIIQFRHTQLNVPCARSEEDPDKQMKIIRLAGENDALLPLPLLEDIQGVSVLYDDAESTIYISAGMEHSITTFGRPVPVLMYHCISDEIFGDEPLFTSPTLFREQMQYLLDQNYTPIFFSDLSHLEDFDKPILITLDDGYENNYIEAFPIIKELGICVTIFMISDFLGRDYYLTEAQVREMSESGLVSIQSHTCDHMHLTEHSSEGQSATMEESQLVLTRVTGLVPYVLSYPQGMYNDETETIASMFYDAAVKTGDSLWTSDDGYYHICRISMFRDTTIENLKEKMSVSS